MLADGSFEQFSDLGDNALVSARQRNLETIHQHDVVAERHGLLGDLASELAGGEPGEAVTVEDWLARA